MTGDSIYEIACVFNGSFCVLVADPDGRTSVSPEVPTLEQAQLWIERRKGPAAARSCDGAGDLKATGEGDRA